MRKFIIATIRVISCALILAITFFFVIDLMRLHVPGSGVTYSGLSLEIILLAIPILVFMLLHFEKKQGQFISDIKKVGVLILTGFLPLIFFILLFIAFSLVGYG